MNNPSDPVDTKGASLLHLFGLRFLLAGDLASAEHIDSLLERIAVIDWNDPEFARFTEEMQTGTPHLTLEQEASLGPSLSALVYAANERIAADGELLSSSRWALEKMLKHRRQLDSYLTKVVDYTCAVLQVSSLMKTRLQALGVDVSDFQLPPLPVPETDV